MEMKKTILVSALTTIATMFIIMICIHMCKSHCGQSRCSKASVQCSSSYGGNGCDSYSGCTKSSSCSSKSKCSKAKKCCKSKSSCKKGENKTCKWSSKDGEKVIGKKGIKVEKE
ncbi:MAG: hypothetical protein COB15_01535 [Flavobacteriales bacterium]|nr:MAG: hypothetical protein COB15_01535 [Flavobacteriales bacterium]